MKRDLELGWDLIEHDPLLRVELSAIEKSSANEEEMVNLLIDFFTRTDKMIRIGELIGEGRS